MSAPRLLVLTQSIDLEDPVLGFFHGWLRAFSGTFPHIHAVCLKEGRHALPDNVTAHSLGKERGVGRLGYVWRFYRLMWSLRHEYDTVFVHMNPEYVVLGGLLWRLMGKKVVLWRNHRDDGFLIRVSALIADRICYTSPEAFVARYLHSVRMPVGIDTAAYALPRVSKPGTLLSLGRLDPIKKIDVLLRAVEGLREDLRLDIYGSPSKGREAYLEELRTRHKSLEEKGAVAYKGDVRHADTPSIYASHDIFVNLTPSGSFDKTLFEAMAAGCLIVTSNQEMRSVVHSRLFVEDGSVDAVAAAIEAAIRLPQQETDTERVKLKSEAEKHSLGELVKRLVPLLACRR